MQNQLLWSLLERANVLNLTVKFREPFRQREPAFPRQSVRIVIAVSRKGDKYMCE